MNIIQDGTGSGYRLKINKLNRLENQGFTTNELTDISQRGGLSFSLATEGFIDLTTLSTHHGIFYLKNNSSIL